MTQNDQTEKARLQIKNYYRFLPLTSKMSNYQSCSHCGTVFNPHLKKCAKCGKVSYCNKNCQKTNWKNEHKIVCQAPPPSPKSFPVPELSKILLCGKNTSFFDVTSIPSEIWTHIFKYLSNKDIFQGDFVIQLESVLGEISLLIGVICVI